jgi:hypothetical protein
MTPAICAEGHDDPRLPRAENDIDDRGSAAANEDRALRELQRLVEDLAPSEAYSPADAPNAAGGSRSDVAGNRPGRADMDASGRPREKPAANSVPLSEQAVDVLRGLCPATGFFDNPVFAPIGDSARRRQGSTRN